MSSLLFENDVPEPSKGLLNVFSGISLVVLLIDNGGTLMTRLDAEDELEACSIAGAGGGSTTEDEL